MAYICYRPRTKDGCKGCSHYRFDPESMRMACFAQKDESEALKNNTDKMDKYNSYDKGNRR